MSLSPINQTNLFSLDSYLLEFVELYKKKRLPTKILLSGDKGLGKSTLAFHLVNYILSINEEHSYIIKESKINPDNKSYKLAINGLAILPKKNNSNTLLKNSEIKLLQLLLRNFGYKISLSSLMDKETLQVIYAFESHYCPEELDEFRVKRKLLGYLRYLISIKRET